MVNRSRGFDRVALVISLLWIASWIFGGSTIRQSQRRARVTELERKANSLGTPMTATEFAHRVKALTKSPNVKDFDDNLLAYSAAALLPEIRDRIEVPEFSGPPERTPDSLAARLLAAQFEAPETAQSVILAVFRQRTDQQRQYRREAQAERRQKVVSDVAAVVVAEWPVIFGLPLAGYAIMLALRWIIAGFRMPPPPH